MIEKIGTDAAKFLSTPCYEVKDYLGRLLKNNPSPLNVAEIGVGYGATSIEIVKMLREEDTFYFYSFQDEVDELYEDLSKQDYCKCKLVPLGNSHTLYDSFCWNLGKQVIDPNNKNGLFDLVFLDGAHSFLFTGLACVLSKKLIRKNGYLILDDLQWSYGNSYNLNPQVYPQILEQYTQEQVDTLQVLMVVDAFLENDINWKCLKNNKRRAVYKKVSTANAMLSIFLSRIGLLKEQTTE